MGREVAGNGSQLIGFHSYLYKEYFYHLYNKNMRSMQELEEGSIALGDREWVSKQRYRNSTITIGEYWDLLREQGGVCAICGQEDKFGRNLAVDHCHKTGKVRGLLCTNCNVGLGHFQDNQARLKKALAYLRRRR